ncbi:TPA: hypothetical protein ACWYF9_004145 [Citrobacter braakii]
MKLPFLCSGCLMSQDSSSFQSHSMLLQDNDIYEFTCSLGHRSKTKLENEKFELLFEIGINAYRDGYTREAITSIAASLERFYEYYVRVIAFKNGIDTQAFNNAWKKTINLSERQYGAFSLAYLFENKNVSTPTIDNIKPRASLPTKKEWKAFRNSVVHNGAIPTPDEVLAYGDIVYQHIYELIAELHTSNNGLVASYDLSRKIHPIINALNKHSETDAMITGFISSMRLPTILSIQRLTKPYADLNEVIKNNPEWII